MIWIRSGIVLACLVLTNGGPAVAWTLPGRHGTPTLPALPAPTLRAPLLPSTAQDSYWGDEFGLPIPNGIIQCAVVFDGDLIVGGGFTVIGGNSIAYLARWDGSRWSVLGSGVDGGVAALLVDGYRLLVGGSFRHAGGLAVEGLAAWNGSSWSAVTAGPVTGGGEFQEVRAMTFFQGELIVAGNFESASNPDIRNIARNDGTSWLPLGSGLNGTVRALAIYDKSLYATGDFSGSDSVSAPALARWDGSLWSSLGGFSEGSGQALAVFQNRLWVGGNLTRVPPLQQVGLSSWDGSTWTYSGYQDVTSLHVHQDGLAIGYFWGVDLWDGEAVVSNVGIVGAPYTVTSSGSDLIIGGWFSDYGDPPFHLVRWDGTTLHSYETWTPSMNGLAAGYGGPPYVKSLASYRDQLVVELDDVWETFHGHESGWEETQRLPTWTGSTWTSFEPDPPYVGQPSITLSFNDRLFMAGFFTEPAPPGSDHWVVQYDGTEWTSLDTLPGPARAMGIANGNPHVALGTVPGAGMITQHVYSWDGTRWIPIGVVRGRDSSGDGPVEGITEYHGELIVHGEFTGVGDVFAPGIAAWNGQSWHPLGPGAPGCYLGWGDVRAVTYQDRLIVPTYHCDLFSDLGSLQEWDGVTWSTLPGLRGTITSLASIHGLLYVGGDLTIDGVPDQYVAAWDGRQWIALGSGLDGPPYSIVEHQGGIHFGGLFSVAGGKASFGLARWTRTVPVSPTRLPSMAMAGPNPFRVSADLTFWMESAGSARVGVYDIQGREIAVLSDGPRSDGVHAIRWNGRDQEGRSVPAGVYFVKVRTEEGESSRKIIHLK